MNDLVVRKSGLPTTSRIQPGPYGLAYRRWGNCGRVVVIFLGKPTQDVHARTGFGEIVDTPSTYFQQTDIACTHTCRVC